MSPTPTYHMPEPPKSGLLPALAAGAIIALFAFNIYLYVQIDHTRTDLAKMQDSFNSELANLKDASSVNSATQRAHLETLKKDLEVARAQARDQARTMSSQGKAEAVAHADQLARQIQAEEAKALQQQSSEISEAKQAANTANAKIADVSTDVGGVKSQVSATQAELQKTIATLKSTIGDLGVASGLIATNSGELQALKLRNDRNYFEFKLGKEAEKKPARVGDITIQIKKVDPKRHKYTINVMADDTLTEKRDKSINEPVQFYTSKAKLPYEIVVNKVEKDTIVGYLATPKEQAAR